MQMKQNRAVFLDLNGADLAIMRLLAAGLLCPIVTVQARIERGCSQSPSFVPGLLVSLGTWGST
jgi:hypothetical protein